MNVFKIKQWLMAIIQEDGDNLSYGSHRTLKLISDELEKQPTDPIPVMGKPLPFPVSEMQLQIGKLEVHCFDEDSEMAIKVGKSHYQHLSIEETHELSHFIQSHLYNETGENTYLFVNHQSQPNIIQGEGENPNCSQHLKSVAGIEDMKVLAGKIGNLHYETLSKLLFELQTKIHNDSIKDLDAGRFNLSQTLHRASHRIYEASNEIESAWQISKPFMTESNSKQP